MKMKRLKDYTQEELNRLSDYEMKVLHSQEEARKVARIVILSIIGLFLIITLFNSFKSIPTGYVGVKTQFGKVQDTMLNEGINFKIPYIEKIVLMDCRTQKCEYTMEASSKDLQKISNIKIAINYNVSATMANQLYRQVGVNYETILVEPAIYESVKQGMSQYTAEELITKRSDVANVILELLTTKLSDKGITITALNIIDLNFSAEFDAAIEAKQITEQQTIQAQYELEKAKVQNQQKVENAKSEAEVMALQNSQITEQTLKLKELEIMEEYVEKWNGNLPTTMLNDNFTGLFNLNK